MEQVLTTRPLRILLLEDSEPVDSLVEKTLLDGGATPQIKRVFGSAQLSEALAQSDWDVAIAVCPRLDKSIPQSLQAVRARCSELPFIIVTSQDRELEAVECMKHGAHDYVLRENLVRLVPAVEREVRESRIRHHQIAAENALRLSEKRFKAVFRTSPVPILICNPEDGQFIEANPAFFDLIGSPNLPRGADLQLPFLAPDSLKDLKRSLATEGSMRSREVTFFGRSGEEMSAILSAEVLPLPAQPRLLILLQDITERKKNEARLQESRERYRHLIENSNDLVCEISQDLRILYASSNCVQLLGITPLDMLGRSLLSIIHPEDVIDAETRLALPSITGLWRYWHKEGSWRWFEASGRTFQNSSDQVRAVIVSRDVTERQRIEQAFHAVAKGTAAEVNDFFFRTLVRELSAALHVRFAMVAEQAVDHHEIFRVIAFCDQGQMLPEMSFAIEGSPFKPILSGESVHITNQLYSHWQGTPGIPARSATSLVAVPLQFSDGLRTGFLAVLHDHPIEASPLVRSVLAIFAARAGAELERVQSESEKRKLQGQLFLSQKMEAIGTMAGGIAHDFNNILSAIIVFTELACMDISNRTAVLEHLDQVLKAGNRAKELVKQILAFSRRQQEERRPILLQPIVKEALKLLRSTLPSTMEIVQEIDPSTPYVLADPSQVHQVLMNLATNAEHAMRGKVGKLTVRLDSVDFTEPSQSKGTQLQPGRYARLRVSDQGHGMPSDVLERIFDPFFTTKAAGEGTGLGLAVVHTIMTNHNGAINVTSAPGAGSTFELFFQAREGREEQVDLPKELPRASYREHVLIVDDESAVVEGTRRILERLGYRVSWQSDPFRALALFELQQDSFDLVITDLTMPSMTGLDLAARLLRRRPSLPIILTTGYGQDAALKKAKQIGIKALLMKPAEASELANLVSKVLKSGANTSPSDI